MYVGASFRRAGCRVILQVRLIAQNSIATTENASKTSAFLFRLGSGLLTLLKTLQVEFPPFVIGIGVIGIWYSYNSVGVFFKSGRRALDNFHQSIWLCDIPGQGPSWAASCTDVRLIWRMLFLRRRHRLCTIYFTRPQPLLNAQSEWETMRTADKTRYLTRIV